MRSSIAGLTYPQIKALLEFASANGRCWKQRLRDAWEKSEAGSELQQVRNNHGPVWLGGVNTQELRALVLIVREATLDDAAYTVECFAKPPQMIGKGEADYIAKNIREEDQPYWLCGGEVDADEHEDE